MRVRENVKFPSPCFGLKNVLNSYEQISGLNYQNLLVNLNKKTKSLFPTYFGGFKFNANKVISESLLYNCMINIDTSDDTNYQSTHRFINKELLVYPSPGFFNVTFNSNINDQWKCVVLAKFLPKGGGGLDIMMNYFNKNFNGSISISNKTVSTAEITFNYMQEVDKNLVVGAEVVNEVTSSTLNSKFLIAGRYLDSIHNVIVSGSVGTRGAQLCLYKMLAPKISIGSIFDCFYDDRSSLASLACQWTEKNFIVRCSIDTNKYFGMNIIRNICLDENVRVNINWGTFSNFVNELTFGIGLDFFIKN